MAIQQVLLGYGSGGGGGGSLFDEIMADSPWSYFRHSEASGATMENEVGADGLYVGSPTLGNAATYAGGPTSVLFETGKYATYGVTPPPINNELSMVTVVNFNAISGLRGLLSRDNGSSIRSFQWRLSGSNVQFVVVSRNGGLDPVTLSAAHGMGTGSTYIVGMTLASSGLVNLYVNGSSIGSTTMSGSLMLGNAIAGGGFEFGQNSAGVGTANAYFSESAIFYSNVGATRMAAYAAAAGL